MIQHLQKQNPPQNAFSWSKPKKRVKKSIDKNTLQHRLFGKESKNNNTSKNKKQKELLSSVLTQNSEKEPIISIAFNYGIKNGRNQVLHEYINPSPQEKVGQIEMNSFQKILNRHRKSRNFSEQSKRLTFVNFKKTQRDSFLTCSDLRSFGSKRQKRAKTQPASITSCFQRTSFPKQLTDLKQEITELVTSKQNRKKPVITLPATTYPQQFNVSTLTNTLNQTMMNTQTNYFGDNTYEKRQLFKGSKCQSIKDYIEQINEVITYADQVMHEEDELDFKDQLQLNHAYKSKDPKRLTNCRKYWPQYKRYTLNLRRENEDQEAAKFFNSFSQSDLKLDNQLQSLVNTIKMDLNHQEHQMNKEIAKSQKNAIELRFKYKMDIERENYKRNIKSFIKCKKQYKIQRRREEVRANGIIRLKKATKPQKMINKVEEKNDQN